LNIEIIEKMKEKWESGFNRFKKANYELYGRVEKVRANF
jgi:hypothetical protein